MGNKYAREYNSFKMVMRQMINLLAELSVKRKEDFFKRSLVFKLHQLTINVISLAAQEIGCRKRGESTD
jgi:hypothetical protein